MSQFQMLININENGIDLKIATEGVVGTLHVQKAGIAFSEPDTKKQPKIVGWNRLPTALNGQGARA